MKTSKVGRKAAHQAHSCSSFWWGMDHKVGLDHEGQVPDNQVVEDRRLDRGRKEEGASCSHVARQQDTPTTPGHWDKASARNQDASADREGGTYGVMDVGLPPLPLPLVRQSQSTCEAQLSTDRDRSGPQCHGEGR